MIYTQQTVFSNAIIIFGVISMQCQYGQKTDYLCRGVYILSGNCEIVTGIPQYVHIVLFICRFILVLHIHPTLDTVMPSDLLISQIKLTMSNMVASLHPSSLAMYLDHMITSVCSRVMLSLPLSGNYMMLLRKVKVIKSKPTMCIVVRTIQYL